MSSPAAAAATTTPAPTTTIAAADYTTSSDFEGWYLQTTPQPIVCGGTLTYFTSSTFAQCYDPSSSAPMPTGCSDSVLLMASDMVGTCDPSYSCGHYKIFPTEGASDDQSVILYNCLINWAADSIYRSLPARYASSTAGKEESATATHTMTTAKHPHSKTASKSQPTATNAPSTSSGVSGGAIGGIVVGCVAAVAIIGLLFLFRKKIMALFGKGGPHADGGPTWSPVETPAGPHSEMATTEVTMPPSEMSSEANAVHEIGSSQGGTGSSVGGIRPAVVHELS